MTSFRGDLGDLLRARRARLQPEDVGLPRGPRRRAAGLRREEVVTFAAADGDDTPLSELVGGRQPGE